VDRRSGILAGVTSDMLDQFRARRAQARALSAAQESPPIEGAETGNPDNWALGLGIQDDSIAPSDFEVTDLYPPGLMAKLAGKAMLAAGVMKGAGKRGAGKVDDVLNALPMDEASRMARAKEMEFDVDTPLYHGTSDDVVSFDLNHPNRKDTGWLGTGVYLTDNKDLASSYSRLKRGDAGPNVMPVFAKLKNPYYATLKDKQMLRDFSTDRLSKGRSAADEWTDMLKAKGHDGVILEYKPSDTGFSEKAREIVVFDPAHVRSRFAKFDRAYKDSAELSKARGGAVRARARAGLR